MSDHDPPQRWSVDGRAPPELRAALRGARRFGPSEAQVRDVADGVARAVRGNGGGDPRGGGSGPPDATPRAAAAAIGSGAASSARGAIAGVSGAILVAVVAVALLRRSPAAPVVRAATRHDTSALPVVVDAAPSPRLGAAAAGSPHDSSVPTAPDAPWTAAAGGAGLAAATSVGVDAGAASDATRAPRLPCHEREQQARMGATQRALGAAQLARVLQLTNVDRARCPRGELAEDRERFAIEALARLGRRDEALARWRAFNTTFPESLHQRRLRQILGLLAP